MTGGQTELQFQKLLILQNQTRLYYLIVYGYDIGKRRQIILILKFKIYTVQ